MPFARARPPAPGRSRARLADGAGALGLDPGPGDREPVGGQPQAGDQGDVVDHPAAVVGSGVAGVATGVAGGRERVPDGGPAPVEVEAALDLVRGGARAPEEAIGERLRPTAGPADGSPFGVEL